MLSDKANSTVVCGATVGRHSFVGAGAVVGNPARVAGWMCAWPTEDGAGGMLRLRQPVREPRPGGRARVTKEEK
jgi:UDP-2-acetamido-3-amino-2,3-dideoxy-glucuronate N-acetyltransferase